MPAITYTDFSGGLDRRLPIDVQEASRLWTLQNAYITLGKRIKKRPALRSLSTGLTGSFGLGSVSGNLTVFSSVGSGFAAPGGVSLISLNVPPTYGATSLTGVSYADVFGGYAYVVGIYQNPVTPTISDYRHHYVDTATFTYITDTNCPAAASVSKAASRLFAINGESVRYCAAGNPRDWTTAGDAGFLPAALQQDTKASCSAVGSFGSNLVVFFPDGAQIWSVAVDPSANEIARRIHGVGCTQPLSLAAFANDLMFLSPYGFRSMTVQALVDRIDDTDVGVQVDSLVVPDLATTVGSVFGVWIHELGQYWAVFPQATTTIVWAYTYSKSSKIACWSKYTFPVVLTAATSVGGKVYVRTASTLYDVTATAFQDDGTGIDVVVQMAFQNAKSPGVEKQWYGADAIFAGTANLSYLYDPRDQTKETIAQAITGNSAPGQMIGVEVVSTAIAPVVRHSANEAFEFTQLSIYHNALLVT